MSWWSVWDEALLAVVVLFGPGLLVGALGGLRRVWLLAVAPPVSIAVLGVAAIVYGAVGIGWTRATAAAAVLVVAAVVGGARYVLRRRWGADRARTPGFWWAVGGVAVSLPLAALPIKRGMIDPGMPAQTWDTPFHVNAIRWVLDRGDGSSLHLGAVATNPERHRFYPAGWHDVASLVVTDSIPATINVLAIVVACLVWPLAVACLVAVLVPRSRVAPFLAPVVAAGFVAFPARMQSVGTLWPNALAFAMVPVALALTVRLTGMQRSVGPDADPGHRVPVALGLVATLGGIGLCHPNAVLAYAVLAAPLWAATWWRAARRYRSAPRAVRAVVVGLPVLVVLGAVVLVASPLLQGVLSYERDRMQDRGSAALSVLTDSQLDMEIYGNPVPEWSVALLVLLGAVTLVAVRRGRWLVVSGLVVVGMYTLTVDPSRYLGWLVGPWYSDPLRIGAMAVLVLAPVATMAFVGAGEALAALLRSARRPHRHERPDGDRAGRLAATTVPIVLLAVVVVATGWSRADVRQWMYDLYYAEPELRFGLVTPDELAMLERTRDELPEDSVVLGNPFTGAPFVYGIGGHDVVFPHITGGWGADELLLGDELDRAGVDPEVCAALDRTGATHLYVDERPYWPENENQETYEALQEDPAELDLGLELVDEGGSARIYEIRSCG